MADVFISYSKQDLRIAQALADDLKRYGLDVWWDTEIYAGDNFHDEIRAELQKARAVVVVWSKTAVASNWVRGEAGEALDKDKIISTYVPDFDVRDVPLNFRALHMVRVDDRESIYRAIEHKRVSTARVPAAPTKSETRDDLGTVAAKGGVALAVGAALLPVLGPFAVLAAPIGWFVASRVVDKK